MSVIADCGSCASGNHARHVRDWNIHPGLIGGEWCACTGDCAERAKADFDAVWGDIFPTTHDPASRQEASE